MKKATATNPLTVMINTAIFETSLATLIHVGPEMMKVAKKIIVDKTDKAARGKLTYKMKKRV